MNKKLNRPRGKTFVVFDFKTATTMRSRTEHGMNFRLEHYLFRCYNDGSYEFEFQEGWHAGSHYDGGTAHNDIPEEWLALSWEEFIDKFCEEYPAKGYFLEKYELLSNESLKAFLGF